MNFEYFLLAIENLKKYNKKILLTGICSASSFIQILRKEN